LRSWYVFSKTAENGFSFSIIAPLPDWFSTLRGTLGQAGMDVKTGEK